jgi:tripartite-type tricarboxylate transporter receptor subunit TctC
MTISRRAALAAPLLGLAMPGARAQGSFPDHPLRVVVPYTPGGSADIAARLIGEKLGPRWGQPFIVENKAGANGIIGTDAVAKAPADGYTLGCISVVHAVNVALYRTPYDTLKDLVALSVLYTVPLVLVAAPDFPANTPQELAALAKRDPARGSYAGTGGTVHLAGAMFAAQSGAEMTHVPYRGSTAAHPDLMAGRVSVMFDPLPSVLGHVQSGKLKALAVTSPSRVASLPDVPTMIESGFPGFEAATWGALIGPAGIPPAIATKISTEVNTVLRTPEMRERFAGLGAEVVASSPEEAQAFVRAEIAKWSEVAQRAGIEKQ